MGWRAPPNGEAKPTPRDIRAPSAPL
jgi:hypothetical protein